MGHLPFPEREDPTTALCHIWDRGQSPPAFCSPETSFPPAGHSPLLLLQFLPSVPSSTQESPKQKFRAHSELFLLPLTQNKSQSWWEKGRRQLALLVNSKNACAFCLLQTELIGLKPGIRGGVASEHHTHVPAWQHHTPGLCCCSLAAICQLPICPVVL